MATNAPSSSTRKRSGQSRLEKSFLFLGLIFALGLLLLGNNIHYSLPTNRHTESTLANSLYEFKNKEILGKKDGLNCRYAGHCPVGKICDTGKCVEYLTADTRAQDVSNYPQHDTCVQACMRELTLDEFYQDQSKPILKKSFALPNQYQCALIFAREPAKWDNPPSLEEWMQTRFRHVVRTDPMSHPFATNSTAESNDWKALCNYPCEDDQDCPKDVKCLGRKAYNGTVPILEAPKTCNRPTRLSRSNDVVFVAASNGRSFRGLWNFVASVRFWAPGCRIAVYNLGMKQKHIKQIKSWVDVTLFWEAGIPKTYPNHVQEVSNFAWKPIIINETVHRYKTILYSDAGSTIVGPIRPIQEILHREGLFLAKGQDQHMYKNSHPGAYRWFGYNKSTFKSGGHFAGSVEGFVWPSRYIDTIVIPNAKCALDVLCIAPNTDHRMHRYDQTSLSILSYQKFVHAHHWTEYLAAQKEQLSEDPTKPNRFVIYTSRGFYSWYRDHVNITQFLKRVHIELLP